MKHTIEYNLPDDEYNLTSAINGIRYRRVLREMLDHLRSTLKHGEIDDAQRDIYQDLQEYLISTISEYGVHMEDI
jgi:hypothetical protein